MAPPFLSSTLTVWFCRLFVFVSQCFAVFVLIATSSYGSSFFVFNTYRLVLSSFLLMFECFAALFTNRHIILWLLLFFFNAFFAFNAYRLILPSFVLVFECFAALFTHRDIILWLLFCLQRLPFGFAVFCLNVRIFCRPFY